MRDSLPDTFEWRLANFLAQNNYGIPKSLFDRLLHAMHALYKSDLDYCNRARYPNDTTYEQIVGGWKSNDRHVRTQQVFHRTIEEWFRALFESFAFLIEALPDLPPGDLSLTFDPPVSFLKKFTSPLTQALHDYNFFSIKAEFEKPQFPNRPSDIFRHTGLKDLFPIKYEFSIPMHIQFAHTWIVAGTGHGKTSLLTTMMIEHIPSVLDGTASIVLLDSQNVIIPALERLAIWRDNDRLIVIDPLDPIAFSLFDVPENTPGALAAAIELVHFTFSHLSGSDLTYRQENLFDYLTEFLITTVPDATIRDFENLLDKETAKEYEPYFDQAPDHVRKYLLGDFTKDKFTVDARMQVLTRMRRMLRLPAFTQMFSAPRTKLNLFKELERGVCILIRPSKGEMGDLGTQLFGRFWIAQMKTVAQQRQLTSQKTPTFFYIDECQDYLRGGEPKLQTILDQARKECIGATLLCHNSDQFNSRELVNLLGTNTQTKIVGSPGANDLATFCTYLQCEPSFIMSQKPTKTFAAFIRGATTTAISFAYPFADLTKLPRMSEKEWRAMRHRNRDRYGAAPEAPRRPTPAPAPKTVGHTSTVTFPEFNLSLPCILDTGADNTFIPCPYTINGKNVTFTLGRTTATRPILGMVRTTGFDGATLTSPIIQLILSIEGHIAIEECALGARGDEILIGRTFMAGRLNISSSAHENVKPQPTDKRPNRNAPGGNSDLDPDL